MMHDIDLGAIEARAAAATGVRWEPAQAADGPTIVRADVGDGGVEILRITREGAPASIADVEFIGHARRDTEMLVAHLRGARTMTAKELADIETRCSRASPGPWRAFLEKDGGLGGSDVISVSDGDDQPDLYIWLGEVLAPSADFEFVAQARQEIPQLLTAARAT